MTNKIQVRKLFMGIENDKGDDALAAKLLNLKDTKKIKYSKVKYIRKSM